MPYPASCETFNLDQDECDIDSHICVEGSTCVNIPGRYECLCVPGYQGQLCDEGKFLFYSLRIVFLHLDFKHKDLA